MEPAGDASVDELEQTFKQIYREGLKNLRDCVRQA